MCFYKLDQYLVAHLVTCKKNSKRKIQKDRCTNYRRTTMRTIHFVYAGSSSETRTKIVSISMATLFLARYIGRGYNENPCSYDVCITLVESFR